MNESKTNPCEPEHDFALIVDGVSELTQTVEDALFNAGCDDATLSMQYGLLYVEFSRAAKSLEEAIISAIKEVRSAGIGAEVLRVDECNLVTMSESHRRRIDCDASLRLFRIEIGLGGSIINVSHPVRSPRVIKDSLGRGRLSGIDMSNNANVSDRFNCARHEQE